MAQAEHLTSAIRWLITDGGAKPSTKPSPGTPLERDGAAPGPLRKPHPDPLLAGRALRRLVALTGPPKTDPQPSPIFVYEFDAGGLNCSLQLRTCFIRDPRAKSTFQVA